MPKITPSPLTPRQAQAFLLSVLVTLSIGLGKHLWIDLLSDLQQATHVLLQFLVARLPCGSRRRILILACNTALRLPHGRRRILALAGLSAGKLLLHAPASFQRVHTVPAVAAATAANAPLLAPPRLIAQPLHLRD